MISKYETALAEEKAETVRLVQLQYEVVYSAVNEDGEVYDSFTTLEDALVMLYQFPNDTVSVSLKPKNV